MEMVDQGLQACFVHIISKIAEGGTHNEKENDCTEDDGDLDPFHAGDEGEWQEKDIAGKRDKDGNEESILNIEWEFDVIVPDGEEDDSDDKEGKKQPNDFCQEFISL